MCNEEIDRMPPAGVMAARLSDLNQRQRATKERPDFLGSLFNEAGYLLKDCSG